MNEAREETSICSDRIVDQICDMKLGEAETVGHAFHMTTASMINPSKHKEAPRTRLENLVMMIRLICGSNYLTPERCIVFYESEVKITLHFLTNTKR